MSAVETCDVLVIGCGPAGLTAAASAARAGLKVVAVDKRQLIDKPIHCAEGIGAYLTHLMPFRLPGYLILQPTRGICFLVGDRSITRDGTFYKGATIDRSALARWLYSRALLAGAEIQLETEVVDYEVKDEGVGAVSMRSVSGDKTIVPRLVIAADGTPSVMWRHPAFNVLEDRTYCCASEMAGIPLKDTSRVHVRFEPLNYSFTFPKGGGIANAGIGVMLTTPESIDSVRRRFADWIAAHPEVFANARHLEDKSGYVQVFPISRWISGNVILAGAAANQTVKPFVEGIMPAMTCGDLAGRIAGAHLRGGKSLDPYVEAVKLLFEGIITGWDENNKRVPLMDHPEIMMRAIERIWFERCPADKLLVTLLVSDLIRSHEAERMLTWPEEKVWAEGAKLTRRLSARARELLLYSGLCAVLKWRRWRVDRSVLPIPPPGCMAKKW